MTRKSSKQLKFVAFIMSLVMLMTVAPLSAFAENGVIDTSEAIDQVLSGDEIISDVEPAAVENAAALTAADVPEFIAMSDLTTRGTIRRVYEEESDMSTILFENNDGTRTLYMYGVPVKYIAPDGTMRDKSTAISSLSGLQALWNGTTLTPGQMTTLAQNASIGRLELGQAAEALSLMNTRLMTAYGSTLRLTDMAYASLDSDIRSLYPTAVSDGVVLNYGDYSIRTIPVATGSLVLPGAANVAESTSLTDNDIRTRVRYSNAFGLGTILQYTPTTMGVKEEIILTSNVGKNSFSFRIETDGLTIQEENGNYFFFDPATQRVIAQLGEIIAYDSNGQIARGAVTVQSVIVGQRYNVTIAVSPEFLANAVYPVSVDPTTTIYATNSAAIQYASLYNTADAWNYTFESFHVFGTETSYSSYGPTFVGRALFRFPGFGDAFCGYGLISSTQLASLELKLPTSANLSMTAYPAATSWNSGTRICDPSMFSYYDISYSGGGSYSNGNIVVDLTSIAKMWLDCQSGSNNYSFGALSNGVILMLNDESQYCTVTASDVTAVVDYSYGNFIGDFFFNSLETRTFLGGASTSALTLRQGLLDSKIDNSSTITIKKDITWTLSYAGSGQYYIHPNGQTDKYLMYTGGVGITPNAWTIDNASGGGVTITNGNLVLGATSDGISVSSYLTNDQVVWRMVSVAEYKTRELTTIETESQIIVPPQASVSITIGKMPTNACFAMNDDFIISKQSGDAHILINNSSKSVYSQMPGKISIEVKHIPTGLTRNVEVVFYRYTLEVQHYFDEGFMVRHGSSAMTMLQEFNDEAKQYFASTFLLNITATYTPTESEADRFIKGIDEDISLDDIDITEDCVTRNELRDNFVIDEGRGTDTSIKIIWTGHRLEGDARSASNKEYFVIMMISVRSDSGVLVHEISHQLDAYDHYCEGDGTPCSVKTCDVCLGISNRARTCIMTQSNLTDGHCNDCISIINAHLADHH